MACVTALIVGLFIRVFLTPTRDSGHTGAQTVEAAVLRGRRGHGVPTFPVTWLDPPHPQE